MAQGTTNNNDNVVINPGLRADIMRNLMETKNTLTALGSIYVGQGSTQPVGPSDDQVTVYQTKELQTGGSQSEGKVLQVASDGDLEYGYVSVGNFEGGVSGFNGLVGDFTLPVRLNGDGYITVDGAVATAASANTAATATYATSAGSATSAQTATKADKSDEVYVRFVGSRSEASHYATITAREFITFSDFAGDAQLKTAMRDGAVIAAKLFWRDENNVIRGVRNLMILPGEGSGANGAAYPVYEDSVMRLHAVSEIDFNEHRDRTRIQVYTLE